MRFEVATVLVQVATGGLAFCWVTTRRREVGLGYGWLLRIVFGTLAALGVVAGLGDVGTGATVRNVGGAVMASAAALSLWVSVARREAGVSGQRNRRHARSARVAAMLGTARESLADTDVPPANEFDPRLDLLAPVAGVVALAGAAAFVGDEYALSLARLVLGAAFLGAVTDAMLLGHWYLVQPGLGRGPLEELNLWVGYVWPFEVAALLWPPGMVQVLGGSIDDGYNGVLGWFWLACAISTIALVVVTRLALRERAYSAVMAATGLLYLAILTAFGTDLVARAVLAGS